jgi:LPXTG-site transpeptidase (sortase) family protein
VGDSVLVEWLASPRGGARERSYLVTLVSVVEPDDLTLLADTEDTLTLITCYPFGNSPASPQRFVVRAAPLGAGRGVVDPSPNGGNRRGPST